MNGACPASVTLFHCRFPWQGSALNLAAWAQCPVQGTLQSVPCTQHTALPLRGLNVQCRVQSCPCRLYHAQLFPCVGTNLQCPVQGTTLRGHKPTQTVHNVQCRVHHCPLQIVPCTQHDVICTLHRVPTAHHTNCTYFATHKESLKVLHKSAPRVLVPKSACTKESPKVHKSTPVSAPRVYVPKNACSQESPKVLHKSTQECSPAPQRLPGSGVTLHSQAGANCQKIQDKVIQSMGARFYWL